MPGLKMLDHSLDAAVDVKQAADDAAGAERKDDDKHVLRLERHADADYGRKKPQALLGQLHDVLAHALAQGVADKSADDDGQAVDDRAEKRDGLQELQKNSSLIKANPRRP